MRRSLAESRAIAALADCLYNFLPGSGAAQWGRTHVTFATVAAEAGVGEFWQGGSKKPAITAMLTGVLEHRPQRFEPLMVGIVNAALTYRKKNNRPITADEIATLNGLLLRLGYKFPDLWDHSLTRDPATLARAAESAARETEVAGAASARRRSALAGLSATLEALHREPDRSKAGLGLELLLNELFALFDLAPRGSFRVVGEQIDGSFQMHHQTYLVEAKWEKDPLSEQSLAVFRTKIEGKSASTRGVFIALNGATREAQDAITRGKQPNFFAIDGYDLHMALSERIDFVTFLSARQRVLEEEGNVFLQFPELLRRGRVV